MESNTVEYIAIGTWNMKVNGHRNVVEILATKKD